MNWIDILWAVLTFLSIVVFISGRWKVKKAQNKLSLFLMAGILPLFFILALITPVWIYFTGETFFLANMLKFAEVPFGNEHTLSAPTYKLLSLLALLYLPAGLFAWAIWQGIRITQYVRQRTILSLDLALRVRKIALAMLGMGILLPLFRFMVPLVFYWPHPYAQIVLLLSDFILLLTGGLLFVTFHSMLEGIRAENENKEFI